MFVEELKSYNMGVSTELRVLDDRALRIAASNT